MQTKAVLFDFDGVIADSLATHLVAWDEACQKTRNQALSLDERQAIIGHSTDWIGSYLACEDKALAKDLIAEKKALLNSRSQIPALFSGVKETFDYLRERAVPFAIASNAPREYLHQTLGHHEQSVAVVLGIEDVRRAKPEPDLYLLAAKKLKISPAYHHEVVVFEDSTHGLKAATRAGMVPVGISSMHEPSVLKDAGAQLVFDGVIDAIENGFLFG